jgi:hypothetical protein
LFEKECQYAAEIIVPLDRLWVLTAWACHFQGPIFAVIIEKKAMPDNEFPGLTAQSDKAFPASNWFERPDLEPGTPFVQSPPQDVNRRISPHTLFSLFTFEIIRENKVFVR